MTWRCLAILTWPVWRWTISRILEAERQTMTAQLGSGTTKQTRQKGRVVLFFSTRNDRFRGDIQSKDRFEHLHRELEGRERWVWSLKMVSATQRRKIRTKVRVKGERLLKLRFTPRVARVLPFTLIRLNNTCFLLASML
jgi:hypothetical protein